jgi:AcrR family transcriptional regulator
MQDIVAESGLSPGSIYIYFKSKEEIIKAVADMRHENERKIIVDAFGTGDRSVALNQLVEAFVEQLSNEDVRTERTIEVQLWGEALCNPKVREIVREGIEESKKSLTEVLAAYQKLGKFSPDLSPDAVARVMLAQFQGFVLQIALDDQLDIKEYVKVIRYLIRIDSQKRVRQSEARNERNGKG